MRPIYVDDQTTEIQGKEKEIIMLGDLYLNGGPYTDPKEAVDKKYVDDAFKNVTINSFEGKLQPDQFPAFNGDLINLAGKNDFKSKEVIKAGIYHNVSYDTNGRIISGEQGKFKFTSDQVKGIDWDKIKFPKTDGIADYLPGFDYSKYLMKNKENIISKDLNINVSEPGTGDTVLNLNGTMKVSEDYFVGKLGELKRDGLETLEVEVSDISKYRQYDSNPNLNQRAITRGVDGMFDGNDYRLVKLDDIHTEHRTLTMVLSGYLYLFVFLGTNNPIPNPSKRIKLTSDGKLPENIIYESINMPMIPKAISTGDYDTFKVWFDGKNLVTHLISKEPNAIRASRFIVIIEFDPVTGKFGEVNTNSALLGGEAFLINHGDIYRLGPSPYAPYYFYYDVNTREVSRLNETLPAEVNSPQPTNRTSRHVNFTVGPYVYVVYGARSLVNGQYVGESVPFAMNRLSMSNGRPFGEPTIVELEAKNGSVDILPDGEPYVVVVNDRILLLIMVNVNHDGYNRGELWCNELKFNPNTGKVDPHGASSYLIKRLGSYSRRSIALSKSSMFILVRNELEVVGFKGSTSSYI